MSKKRAFVKYTKQGRLIPGSLIVTTKGGYPVDGLYTEVPTNICCDTDIPGTITTSPKGWVRYTKKGAIVPGSLVVGKSHPKDGVWKEVTIDLCCTQPTPPLGDSIITVNTAGYSNFYDTYSIASIGWWMNMTDDTNFPRIFTFGAYPTASQAVSIEGGNLLFWYCSNLVFSYPLQNYIGNWIWVSIISNNTGSINLYINGVSAGSYSLPTQCTLPDTMYIGTENTPGTNYNGLLRDFVVDAGNTMSLEIVPTTPLITGGNTVFLLFQGTNLTQQLTNNGVLNQGFGVTVTGSNVSYNIDSPYPASPGSTQFGTV